MASESAIKLVLGWSYSCARPWKRSRRV